MRVKSKLRLSIVLAATLMSLPTVSHNREYKHISNLKFVQAYKVEQEQTEPKQDNLEQYLLDVDLLARLIYSEARGEPYIGKLAVGNVVMNRVMSERFPNTIRSVIYAQGQFCVVRNGMIDREADQDSIDAAIEVMAGRRILDGDVVYFYNPKTASDKWIRTRSVSARYGNHNFSR